VVSGRYEHCRDDIPQLVVSLSVTQDGLSVRHDTFSAEDLALGYKQLMRVERAW